MARALWLAAALAAFTALPALGQPHWPQFRGLSGGVAEDPRLPLSWDTQQNVAWKTSIPGRGWSSPVIWGDKVFITSVINTDKSEDPKKGLYFGGERPFAPKDKHRWMVYCLDAASGKTLWESQAHEGIPATGLHIKNTYASETPVVDSERVYAYFGNVGLFCYDLSGKPLWSRTWKSAKTFAGWGTAASPAVYKDRLFLVNDNLDQSFLEALDVKTGKTVWRVERDEKSNWATPFVWVNEQRVELVTCGSNRVRSYDLDGKLLWELKGMSKIAIPTPVARHGLLFVSSGYVLDSQRPLYAIRPGATGDITLKDGESSNKFIAWSHKLAGPYNPSPLVYGDYLYVLYDRGILACFDAGTGKAIYEKQRLSPEANEFTSSPWAYSGKIFCQSEDGDVFVVEAGPHFKLAGRNKLDDMCMATPAIASGALYIRTLTQLYKIGK